MVECGQVSMVEGYKILGEEGWVTSTEEAKLK